MKTLIIGLLLATTIALTLHAKNKQAESSKLKIGDTAPTFVACDDAGKKVTFPTDFKGKKALVFYPMADTPGCTKEMCSLRDDQKDLANAKITVVGISPSNEKNQKKFKDAKKLPFVLLSSTDEICKLYNVYHWLFIDRHTFIINEKNVIVDIITKVDKKQAAQQIIEAFAAKK